MHPRVEHLSLRVEFICIVLNARVRNMVNNLTVTAVDIRSILHEAVCNMDIGATTS